MNLSDLQRDLAAASEALSDASYLIYHKEERRALPYLDDAKRALDQFDHRRTSYGSSRGVPTLRRIDQKAAKLKKQHLHYDSALRPLGGGSPSLPLGFWR